MCNTFTNLYAVYNGFTDQKSSRVAIDDAVVDSIADAVTNQQPGVDTHENTQRNCHRIPDPH